MVKVNPKGLAAILAAGLVAASPFAVNFIGKWESSGKPVLTVYADKLAHGVPTVCDGLTKAVTDTPIIVGETWTIEKCEAETSRAITAVQSELIFCFRAASAQIPQSVFDVATSHAWNFGYPRTCASEAMKAWQQREWALGCRRLQQSDGGRLVWVYSDGKFLRGLAERRADERENCL